MLFGFLKEGFSAYSSPVMLISRKVMEDKRVVTEFRHLNMQISKSYLAYPLLKDTFKLLGSSKHKVLSVLDPKDAFIDLDYLKTPRSIAESSDTLAEPPICIKGCLWV